MHQVHPLRVRFWARKEESPARISSQRLDAGLADAFIKLPTTNETAKIPVHAFVKTEEQDPFITSPLGDQTGSGQPATGVAELLKKMGDPVTGVRRRSLVSNLTDPRASLVSNLEPSLLDFISRYGEGPLVENGGGSSYAITGGVTAESGQIPSTKLRIAEPFMPARLDSSKRDLSSLADSDRSSVHLYNMRISQRLASPSVIAASSRLNTSHTTSQAHRQQSTDGRTSFSQTSSSGKIAGLISAEHIRRPSDPQTRRLFEDDSATPRPLSLWRHGKSPDITTAIRKPQPLMRTSDASSFYWSDGETSNGPVKFHLSKKNPNSIAVGGRSESISLPIGSSSASIGNLSVAEESAWFGRKSSQQKRSLEQGSPFDRSTKRNRSVSMPDQKVLGSRAILKVPNRQNQYSTEADETMSEISLDQQRDARREDWTELNAQAIRDLRDEKMSDIEPLDLGRDTEPPPELVPSWLHAGPSVAGSYDLAARRPNPDQDEVAGLYCSGKPLIRESATNLWQRSFKLALEEPENDSLGGFLTSPRFDRDGRRRSTRSSISAVHPPQEHQSPNAGIQTDPQNEAISPNGKTHIELCMKKPDPLPTVKPRRSIAIMETKKEDFNTMGGKATRKNSLLDVRRRFSSVENSQDVERRLGASTPLKDLLGHWARFPSHTREERTGSAGAKDGVAVRDFAYEHDDENIPSTRAITALGLHTPGSWKVLSFGRKSRMAKRKTKSASPLPTSRSRKSISVRPKKSRTGFPGRMKKLYHSGSTDFRAYTSTYGHRSSISMGAHLRQPALEIIPGSSAWKSHVDDVTEMDGRHLREIEGPRPDCLDFGAGLDTVPWTQMYRECVGSLSALRSDPELQQMSLDDGLGPSHVRNFTLGGMSGVELRDSTVNFESQLGKENEAAKEGLIRKIESMQDFHA